MNADGTRVTLDVARRIALAIGDKPENAIRAAGSLLEDQGDDAPDPRLLGLDPHDEVVQKIMASDLSDQRKNNMLKTRRRILDARKRADLEELEFLISPESEAI